MKEKETPSSLSSRLGYIMQTDITFDPFFVLNNVNNFVNNENW